MAFHKRLFFLLLVLLPTQLGLHYWPVWAVVLGRKIDYLSPTVYVTDVLVVSLLLSFVVQYWRDVKNAFLRLCSHRVILGAVVFLLFVLVNIWIARAPAVSIYKWLKFLEYIALAWYIVYTKPSLIYMAKAISIGIFYTSVLTVFQFVLQHSVGGLLWYLGERTFTLDTPGIARFSYCSPFVSECRLILRPYATFPHPNVLGGFLATALPFHIFGLPFWIGGRKSFFRIVYYWGTLVLGSVALILTFSRGAWFATAGILSVSLFVFFWDKFKKHTLIGMSAKVTAGILSAAFVVFFTFVAVFRPGIADESVVRRIELNKTAINLWRSSPVFGIGLGNFLTELPGQTPGRQINFLQPVHNIYLLMLSEVGLLGLAAFILVHAVVLRRAIFGLLASRIVPRQAGLIYVLSWGFLLMLGNIDHFLLTLQQGQLWLLVLFSLVWQSEK